MHIEQINSTTRLWLDALRNRWSLRQASGDGALQLALHMTSWLRSFVRQTQWLRCLHAREAMWRAAQADPRLYERWHRSYISLHFDADARRRIVSAHYAFVMRRFPAWLAERLMMGGGARLATLRLEDATRVHVHLRKPPRGDAGELNLLLLDEDKNVLASCILTFDRRDSIIIGGLRSEDPQAPFEASRAFIQGSHGLHPTDLLLSLVRELAALQGLKRIRAVTSAARVESWPPVEGVECADAFWEAQGGVAAGSGCHALPLSLIPATCAEGPRSRRASQQQREAFRREACEMFADVFRDAVSLSSTATAAPSARDDVVAAGARGGRNRAVEPAGLLAGQS